MDGKKTNHGALQMIQGTTSKSHAIIFLPSFCFFTKLFFPPPWQLGIFMYFFEMFLNWKQFLGEIEIFLLFTKFSFENAFPLK